MSTRCVWFHQCTCSYRCVTTASTTFLLLLLPPLTVTYIVNELLTAFGPASTFLSPVINKRSDAAPLGLRSTTTTAAVFLQLSPVYRKQFVQPWGDRGEEFFRRVGRWRTWTLISPPDFHPKPHMAHNCPVFYTAL